MFRPLPQALSLGLLPDAVAAVIESINTPNVALPEWGTQPTKAYLVGVLLPNGACRAYVYLLQLETNRPVMFISEPDQFRPDQYPEVEAAGITFLENMGFMLDNMQLRSRTPVEQAEVLQQLPFLREQLVRTTSVPRDEGAAQRAAAARFLASF
jgi:hypothetical protein